MIPIAVSTEEAEYIRSVINRETKKVTIKKGEDNSYESHARHPRLIKQIYNAGDYKDSVQLVMENVIEEDTTKKPDKKGNFKEEFQVLYHVTDTSDDEYIEQDEPDLSKVTVKTVHSGVHVDKTESSLHGSKFLFQIS